MSPDKLIALAVRAHGILFPDETPWVLIEVGDVEEQGQHFRVGAHVSDPPKERAIRLGLSHGSKAFYGRGVSVELACLDAARRMLVSCDELVKSRNERLEATMQNLGYLHREIHDAAPPTDHVYVTDHNGQAHRCPTPARRLCAAIPGPPGPCDAPPGTGRCRWCHRKMDS